MVTVIGLGFVGLTTALGLCEFGETVYGIETNEEHLARIQRGKWSFMEPHIEEKIVEYKDKRFFVDRDLSEAVNNSSAVLLCVGTPYGSDGSADLKYVYSAIDQILSVWKREHFLTIVTKSTIPPATTAEKIVPYIESKGLKVPEDIGVATNPEFLREGYCWDDFIHAGRIVIGVQDRKSEEILRNIYRNAGYPVFAVSYNTSEFIKYLSNSSLACLISFANEMSLAADAFGNIDIAKAFDVVRMDDRWQSGSIRSYLYPGCGYGGYCLPKDTHALYAASKHAGYECKMLGDVIDVNEKMPQKVADRIIIAMQEHNISGGCIGILGLSFKVGSDDVRDATAAKIIRSLNVRGFENIMAYDPCAQENFKKSYPELRCRYANDYEEAIGEADLYALVTPWEEFKDIKKYGKAVIDCRYALR